MNDIINILQCSLDDKRTPLISNKIPRNFVSKDHYFSVFKPFIIREMVIDVRHTKSHIIDGTELKSLDVIKLKSKYVIIKNSNKYKQIAKKDYSNYL